MYTSDVCIHIYIYIYVYLYEWLDLLKFFLLSIRIAIRGIER